MQDTLPQANTALSWGSFLDSLRGLGFDYLRYKLMDVERASDDNNIPDQAELRYGSFSSPGPGGLTFGAWALIGVAAIVGVFLVARMK